MSMTYLDFEEDFHVKIALHNWHTEKWFDSFPIMDVSIEYCVEIAPISAKKKKKNMMTHVPKG